MALVEPAGSAIAEPPNYWWYFVVTAATVGYGDFFPVSAGGHVVGAYVIVGGIVTLTLLFTRLADDLQSVRRSRRMRGMVALDLSRPRRAARLRARAGPSGWSPSCRGGAPPGRAVRLGRRPGAPDARGGRPSPSCAATSRTPTSWPGPASGAPGRSVVDGRDDNETLAIAVAVEHANPDVHIVAALRDLGRREHLRYVNPRRAVRAVAHAVPAHRGGDRPRHHRRSTTT